MTTEGSTTVDRSVRLLFELAENPRGLTISELARRLGTQRPPLYRQIKTLMEARLIRRGENKVYQLSVGVLELARSFAQPLSEQARPALQRAADETDYSASLALMEGGSLVMAVSVQPRSLGLHVHAGVGFTFPKAHSAPVVAALAAGPPLPDEHPDVTVARERGWTGTVSVPSTTGAVGAAVPIVIGDLVGSLSLLRAIGGDVSTLEEERALAAHLLEAKQQIVDFSMR